MIDFKTMIENESINDVILFFSGRDRLITYPQLDNFFVRYRFEVVGSCELLRVFNEMIHDHIIEWDEKMLFKKGINWEEPEFMIDDKYNYN